MLLLLRVMHIQRQKPVYFLHAKANASDVTTSLNTKQATLTAGAATTGSQSILSGSTIKNIVPGTDRSLSSDVNGVTVTGRDSYTKDQVHAKISSLVGTAPAILDTVQGISASRYKDDTFSTATINAFASKANISDTFI